MMLDPQVYNHALLDSPGAFEPGRKDAETLVTETGAY